MKTFINSHLVAILRNIKQVNCSDDVLLQTKDLTSLGFDSLDLMNIVIGCEDKFQIIFDSEDLVREVLNTVPVLVASLMKYCMNKDK